MENVFVTEVESIFGPCFLIQGQDTGADYNQAYSLREAVQMCRDMMANGEISGYCINE
jgi:hypothetical protein